MKYIFIILMSLLLSNQGICAGGIEVFNNTKFSIVKIIDRNSSGSGVLVSSDGFIVTNRHVVSSMLAVKVILRTQQDGKIKTSKFSNVKIVGIHPKLDLALLKVNLKGLKVSSLKLGKTDVKKGSDCFAIGHPGAVGKSMDWSITEGKILHENVSIAGEKFIEISAAVNPGNSGGALCGANSNLLGIVTLKSNVKDRVGYAISSNSFTLKHLLPLRLHPQAPRKTEMLIRKSKEMLALEAAQRVSYVRGGFERTIAIAEQAILASSKEGAAYTNLARIYWELGEEGLMKKYLSMGKKVDPLDSSLNHMLGRYQFSKKSYKDSLRYAYIAVKNSEKGSLNHLNALSLCAVSCHKLKLHFEANYFIRWAEKEARGRADYRDSIQMIEEAANGILSESQLRFLSKPSHNFSFEAMAQLKSGQAKGAKDQVKKSKEKPRKSELAFVHAADEFLANSTPLPANGKEISVDFSLDGARLAYAGNYIVTHNPKTSEVIVYCVTTAKVKLRIPLDNNFIRFAVGGERLIVYDRFTFKLMSWNLKTMSYSGAQVLKIPEEINSLEMGLLNSNQVYFALQSKSSNKEMAWYNMKTKTFKYLRNKSTPLILSNSPRKFDGKVKILSVSEDGTHVVFGSESTVLVYNVRTMKSRSGFSSEKRNWLNKTNDVVMNNRSHVKLNVPTANHQIRRISHNEDSKCLPFYGRNGHLRIWKDKASHNNYYSLCDRDGAELVTVKAKEVGYYPVFASSYTRRIIVCKKSSIFMMPIETPARYSSYTRAKRGQKFSKKMNFEGLQEVEVQDAPKGLVYNSNTKCIEWLVPADVSDVVRVIFLLKKLDGTMSYHKQMIYPK